MYTAEGCCNTLMHTVAETYLCICEVIVTAEIPVRLAQKSNSDTSDRL